MGVETRRNSLNPTSLMPGDRAHSTNTRLMRWSNIEINSPARGATSKVHTVSPHRALLPAATRCARKRIKATGMKRDMPKALHNTAR